MISKRRQAKLGADRSQLANEHQFDRGKTSTSNVGADISQSQAATSLQSGGLVDLGTPANSPEFSKRSRRFGAVTSHACSICRKKRAKVCSACSQSRVRRCLLALLTNKQCDGQTPCGRCKLKGTECVYLSSESQSKAQLRAEVNTLRQRQRTLEQLLAAILTPEQCQDALAHMQDGKAVDLSLELPISSRPPSGSTANMIHSGLQFSTESTRAESRETTGPNPEENDSALGAEQHSGIQVAARTQERQRAASRSTQISRRTRNRSAVSLIIGIQLAASGIWTKN